MKKQSAVLIGFALLVAMMWGASQRAYATAPSDACALLTPAQVEKVVGQPFNAPTKTPLIPPFGDKWGSHCTYKSQKGGNIVVDFFVYVTASPAQAKQWFNMGAAVAKHKSPAAIGDSAYIDYSEIHVLKSNVLYWIVISPGNPKRQEELAVSVASRI